MKKSLFLFFASLSLIGGLSFAANAQTRTPRINNRQQNQQQRIFKGVRSGELTRREFRRLEREQLHIQRLETRAKADGELTRRERARITREQNQASRHIYRQKHDRQDRP